MRLHKQRRYLNSNRQLPEVTTAVLVLRAMTDGWSVIFKNLEAPETYAFKRFPPLFSPPARCQTPHLTHLIIVLLFMLQWVSNSSNFLLLQNKVRSAGGRKSPPADRVTVSPGDARWVLGQPPAQQVAVDNSPLHPPPAGTLADGCQPC